MYRIKRLSYPAMAPDMNMSGLLRSNDHGDHWLLANRNVGGMAVAAVPDDKRMLYVSGMGPLYVSRDTGRTWRTRTLPAGIEVIAPAARSVLFGAGYPASKGLIWRSDDEGLTWRKISR